MRRNEWLKERKRDTLVPIALEQSKSRGHVLGCPRLPVPDPRPGDTVPTAADRGGPPAAR